LSNWKLAPLYHYPLSPTKLPSVGADAIITTMSRLPSHRTGESFIEFALIIILLAIVMLSILLIVGDSVREFFNDIGIRWSLFNSQSSWLPQLPRWLV
jgi:Flp pilus assembly pilin Flp